MTSFKAYPRRWLERQPPAINTGASDVIQSFCDDVISTEKSRAGKVEAETPKFAKDAGSNPAPVNGFRLVSYNILTDNCIDEGQYLYCPSEIRYMDSRHGRIITELRSIDPDVVCLQEVDHENFRDRLNPDMERLGYLGVHRSTSDGQGLATFWKSSKFEMVKWNSNLISDLVSKVLQNNSKTDETPRRIIEDWMKRPNVTTVVHLRHLSNGREIAVCNIHVSWLNLRYPILQAVQIAVSFRELLEFANTSSSSLVYCGDFNTPSTFPAYGLLSQGRIGGKEVENFWKQNVDVEETERKMFSVINEAIPDIFHLPMTMNSAYFSITGNEPSVTNCDGAHDDGIVRAFSLDYIWYKNIKAVSVLETPSLDAVIKEVALPSNSFPSDHILIAADFVFD